jgi:hypothetical protein
MEEGFRRFLKRGGRSESATGRVITYVMEFRRFLEEHFGKELDEADAEDLEAFVEWVEQTSEASARGYLWGISYYYEYTSNEEMRHLAGIMRQQRIEWRPFLLKDFRDISPECVEKLAAAGIRDVRQMVEAGQTEKGRAALSEKTGLTGEVILEVVKLSDLARIPGVKGIRARLYHDAGIDTLDKMAEQEAEELRGRIAAFVRQTGFEGVAPLPAEARFTIAQAKRLPKIVEY